MYKEKYLKYKTKYITLKNQVGGGYDIQDYYNVLRIKDKINNIILSINYNSGEINVIDAKNNMHTIYKLNLDIHDYLNLYGNEWLSRSDYTVKPIYKQLIEIAINELEKNTSVITDVKTNCISQLKHYINLLA
jgi:hypothetical protein